MDIKTKIIVWVAALLLSAMVLLDMVMVSATQRFLIHSEKSKSFLLISLLGGPGGRFFDAGGREQGNNDFKMLTATLGAHDISAALWTTPQGENSWAYCPEPSLSQPIRGLIKKSVHTGKKQTSLYGMTWGVFWKQPKYLVSAAPCYRGADIMGYVGLAVQLDPVFAQLRESQKIIGIYLFINTCILTLIGVYRIYTLVIRPVSKMTELAESYRPEDGVFLLEEGQDNEHARLSKSINRILKLNRDDQAKLQQTVSKLEGALAELRRAQQEIIRSEKLATVGRLSAGIAHEIGNPIGIVLGYLSLLKEKGLGDAQRTDYIERTETEVNRIRMIIRQLLDYSTPSKESLQTVSIHEMIDEVVQMAHVQPLFSKISVAADLKAEMDQVLANPDQLKQLFLNFIVNSADAMEVNEDGFEGRLQIKSENDFMDAAGNNKAQQIIKISFEDNGQGIGRADLERIFDPFFTTKPVGKGSGLGLWVSLLIAEGMGGKIFAESEPGKGTVMMLCLPVAV